jgi:hypothetical protein
VAKLGADARQAGRPLDLAVLHPLGLLAGCGPRTRYAKAAAWYLAGALVNNAIVASDNPAQIAKAVARWGTTRFPDDTYEEWTIATASKLDLAGSGPAARHVTRLGTNLRSVGELPTPASAATTRDMIGSVLELRRMESPAG